MLEVARSILCWNVESPATPISSAMSNVAKWLRGRCFAGMLVAGANRFGLAESVPAAKQPEPCDEPRGLMWPLGDGSSLVRPGLSPTVRRLKTSHQTTF